MGVALLFRDGGECRGADASTRNGPLCIKALRAVAIVLWLSLLPGEAIAQSNTASTDKPADADVLPADAAGELVKVLFDSDTAQLKALLAKDSIAQKVLPSGETLVAAAARYGSPQQVSLLIEAGSNPNARGPEGWTPLLAAIAVRRLETVRVLLESGADPLRAADDGTTPLELAQAYGEFAIVVALSLASPQGVPESDRANLLHLAAASGDLNAVKTLVPIVGNPDAADERGWTALLFAAAGGHLETAKLLLEARAKPNHPARNGITALMVAAHTGNQPIAAALLAAGANPTLRNDFGETAGSIALASGSGDLAKLLGAQPSPASRHQQVAAAAARKDYDEVKRLLDAGAPASRPQAATGDTPALVAASCAGDGSIIKLLVGRGAGLGEKDANGITPLIASVLCNQLEAVRTLAELKAPAQDKTKGGIDAATAAIAHGNAEILAALSPVVPPTIEIAMQLLQRKDVKALALLLRENPDLAQGQNRLELAQKAIGLNDPAILEQVLAMTQYDVNYTPLGSDGSLLLYAIETKSTNSIKTLLKLGAQPTKTIRNTAPFTALEAAVLKGNIEALQAISQAARKQITSIQASLASMGYLNTAADGSWGPASQAALEKFRNKHTYNSSTNLEDALSLVVRDYLRVCNQTTTNIFAALYATTSSRTSINGWFKVEPGQCRWVTRMARSLAYYYVHAGASTPAGDGAKLCVSSEAFGESDADKMKPPCKPNFREALFVKITDTSKPFVVR